MTPQEKIFAFFGAVLGILVIATIVSKMLRRQHDEPATEFIENLNARVNSWWAMVTLIGLAFIFGKTGMVILFAVLSFAALREFVTLTYTRRGDHWALLTAFFVVLPLQYILIWDAWYGLYTVLIPVYAFLFMPIISALSLDPRRFLERVTEVQWGLMICVFCLSHVPALLTLQIPGYEGYNLLLIAFLVGVVQLSDVLQYVWGKLLGRHKIAPTISRPRRWRVLPAA